MSSAESCFVTGQMQTQGLCGASRFRAPGWVVLAGGRGWKEERSLGRWSLSVGTRALWGSHMPSLP